jgi:hypothetical protein
MFKLERTGRFPNWHLNAEPSSSSDGGVAAWLSPSVSSNPLLADGIVALRLEGLRRALSLSGGPARSDGATATKRTARRSSLRSARFLGRTREPKVR